MCLCVRGRWVSEPPTGPCVLSLDSWHSADDSRLSKNQYPPRLPAASLSFVALCMVVDVQHWEDHIRIVLGGEHILAVPHTFIELFEG